MVQRLSSRGILCLFLFAGFLPSALGASSGQNPALKAKSRLLVEQAKGLIEVGRHKDAEAILDRAQQATPRFAPIYHQRGVSYLQLGLYEASKRALSRSIDLNPIPGEPWWERCRVNRILGDLEAALFDCRGAAARIDDHKPYAYMSAIHLDKSDTDDAKRVLKAGIKRLKTAEPLLSELLRLSKIDNTTGALIAWLKTEGARSKHRTKWLLMEAFVQDQLKNQRAAKKLRRQALRTATKAVRKRRSAVNFYWRAQAYLAHGKRVAARKDALEAKRRAPQLPSLGRLFEELKENRSRSS